MGAKDEDATPQQPLAPLRKKTSTGRVKKLTQSEQFKNYCVGIAALSALILGLVNIFAGEPKAEKTYDVLKDQLNHVSEQHNKLQLRMTYFQAREELHTAMEIQKKLDALQQKYDAMVAQSGGTEPSTTPPAAKSAPKPKPKCRPNQVLGSDDKCRYVPRAVASKVLSTEKRAEGLAKALAEERKKRLELERRKKELMRKYIHQTKAPPAPAPKPIKALPDKLDEAGK